MDASYQANYFSITPFPINGELATSGPYYFIHNP